MLRLCAITGQAATIAATWPLWQHRSTPPVLPVVPMPFDFGFVLLLTLALAATRPRTGTIAHGIVLGMAILADQTREQPQVLSLFLLLVASLPVRGAQALGAWHLAALWAFAGIGKLTSSRYYAHCGSFLLGLPDPEAAAPLAIALAAVIAAAELAVGVLALAPRTRGIAGALGCAMHLAILAFLSPLGRDWNAGVWAWNATIAVAAPLLLRRGPVDGACTTFARGAATAFVALPLGFGLGLVDSPIAFQVYTDNTCHAVVLPARGPAAVVGAMPELSAHLPRVPRVFRVWFERTGSPGDRMILVDDRPLAGCFGPREQILSFDEPR